MRRKCKFRMPGTSDVERAYSDGYLLGFSVNSRNHGCGLIHQYPVALIETRKFHKYVLKEVPIEDDNIIFEDSGDL